MTDSEQIDHLSDDLDALINRYCDEYDLTNAAIIGVLQLKIYDIAQRSDADDASP